MCGRFTIITPPAELGERFNVEKFPSDLKPNYNVAPSQNIPVILNEMPKEIVMVRWGLIPFWAKDIKIGYRMINAKAETIMEKTSYKRPFQKQRCLIIADSFFEWKKSPDGKIPYRIMMKNEKPFAFAGIWEKWKDPKGKEIKSCSIITAKPNSLVKKIHDRMAVILPKKKEKDYLINKDTESLLKLLKPYPADEMKAYEISTLINSPSNNNKEVLKPVA